MSQAGDPRRAGKEQADPAAPPAAPGGAGEPAQLLTAYFGERSRVGGHLLADALLDLYAAHEIRASILLRGAQGFGAKHSRRSDRQLTLSEDLPLVAVALDAPERIGELASQVRALAAPGLLTLERARWARSPLDRSPDQTGEVKLTVYLGRHEHVGRTPAFVAACQTLQEHGVGGATVLLGVDGTLHGRRRRARFLARNLGVPMVIVSVGAYEQYAGGALEQLAAQLAEPLFTLERVRVCKRDSRVLRAPHPPAEMALGTRQKLTIVVSEAAHHEHRSVYLELIARLGAAGCAGATALRGIWGFHGDHAPHGDRLLSLRRRVPVITTAIDTPERVAELWPIVDELTSEGGLVTSELLPPEGS
ncbi:MAG TPA: DUF190 domain-containing protein [Solirubrobacteraceae bacterium]|nr:DUF190 domain-containing protein [Solirubrobacteraceae bacterium]